MYVIIGFSSVHPYVTITYLLYSLRKSTALHILHYLTIRNHLLCTVTQTPSLKIMNNCFVNCFINSLWTTLIMLTLELFVFVSLGSCDTRCLQVPGCYHYIWDDPGRLSWTQRHWMALCYYWWGPSPQEQELQAARGLQAHEPGTIHKPLTEGEIKVTTHFK